MSKLEELINKLCPAGVKFQKLGSIGKFYGGITGKSKNDFKNGNRKFITYMNVFKNAAVDLNEEQKVVIRDGETQRTLQQGDIIFTGSSESVEECGYSSVVLDELEDEVYLNSFCFFLRLYDSSVLDPNFSKHLFRSNYIRQQIIKTVSGVTRFNISKKKMENVLIPIPPIEIQSKIADILDEFIELTAELTARKKQYEYYRNRLLNISPLNVCEYKLSQIAKFSYGYTAKAENKGDARFIRITDITSDGHLQRNDRRYILLNDENKKYMLKNGDLVMARTGASFGKTLYFENSEPSIYASFLIKITLDNSIIINKYYWHFSKSNLYWNQANNLVSRGGQQQFNSNVLGNIKINVPPLDIQYKVVNILDHFDAICGDLSIGLPAEIEARQKQYEFYRDQLLTFVQTGHSILTDRQTDRQTESN